MVNQRTIGFDLDGVIIDHSSTRIKLAKDFGVELKPEQTPSEIIEHVIPAKILDKIKYFMYDDPVVSQMSPLMPGVKEILSQVKERDPYFLISRRRNPGKAIDLLKKYELWPKYFNEENSFFVLKAEDKNETAVKLGVTHYIDDEHSILEKLVGVNNKFLFDNLNCFPDAGFYKRLKSWHEFNNSVLQN